MDWTENKLLKINDGLPFVEQNKSYIIYCTILFNLRPTALWHHLGQWPISFDSFNINIKHAKCSICCSCLCFMWLLLLTITSIYIFNLWSITMITSLTFAFSEASLNSCRIVGTGIRIGTSSFSIKTASETSQTWK